MTYRHAPDYGSEIARLNTMVLGLTGAVVSLYAAVIDISTTTEDADLRQALNQKTDEISKRLDEVIAAMKHKNKSEL